MVKIHIDSQLTQDTLCSRGVTAERLPSVVFNLMNKTEEKTDKYCGTCISGIDKYLTRLEEIATWSITKLDLEEEFKLRKSRDSHPRGEFDRGGRWYPDELFEKASCCDTIRAPSSKWPSSLNKHCRTKAHLENLLFDKPFLFKGGNN